MDIKSPRRVGPHAPLSHSDIDMWILISRVFRDLGGGRRIFYGSVKVGVGKRRRRVIMVMVTTKMYLSLICNAKERKERCAGWFDVSIFAAPIKDTQSTSPIVHCFNRWTCPMPADLRSGAFHISDRFKCNLNWSIDCNKSGFWSRRPDSTPVRNCDEARIGCWYKMPLCVRLVSLYFGRCFFVSFYRRVHGCRITSQFITGAFVPSTKVVSHWLAQKNEWQLDNNEEERLCRLCRVEGGSWVR